jgi:hypothetical protein
MSSLEILKSISTTKYELTITVDPVISTGCTLDCDFWNMIFILNSSRTGPRYEFKYCCMACIVTLKKVSFAAARSTGPDDSSAIGLAVTRTPFISACKAIPVGAAVVTNDPAGDGAVEAPGPEVEPATGLVASTAGEVDKIGLTTGLVEGIVCVGIVSMGSAVDGMIDVVGPLRLGDPAGLAGSSGKILGVGCFDAEGSPTMTPVGNATKTGPEATDGTAFGVTVSGEIDGARIGVDAGATLAGAATGTALETGAATVGKLMKGVEAGGLVTVASG